MTSDTVQKIKKVCTKYL